MFLQKMLNRKKTILKQIIDLEHQLLQYPEGNLICSKNGKYTKNIYSHNHEKTYIPKKNIDFAKKLAEKKYITATLADLKNEEKAIDSYLHHYKHHTSEVEKLFNHPSYQKLLFSVIKPVSFELAEWASETYEKNQSHPNTLRHNCISGNVVRSKSEVLIDHALFTHQIPFRYECALKLEEITIYPDFTIRHPKTGKFYYWEHFGIMDSVSYSQNAYQKLQLYTSNGYIPTINLITTFETNEYPLSMETIENVISHYFL